MLQMLRGASEHDEIHQEVEASEIDSDASELIVNDLPDDTAERVHPYGAADKTFKITIEDTLFDLVTLPDYGIEEVGGYIGITAEQRQSINDNKGALKRNLSMPVVAILQNRLIRNVHVGRKSEKGTSNAFYEALLDICIKTTRVVLNAQVNGRQLIMHVRILVLDGIKLGNSDIILDVIHLVRRGALPLSLLSVRETGLVKYKHSLDYIGEQIKKPAEKRTSAAANGSTSPSLGIYLFGKKDSPGPQIRRLGSGTTKTSSRSSENGKIKSKGRKSSSTVNGEDESSIMSVIGDQLGYQWQMLPGAAAGDTDKPQNSNTASPAYPDHDWYRPAGEVIPCSRYLMDWGCELDKWTETMKEQDRDNVCGLRLAFDAVLCPGPRHNRKWVELMLQEEPHSNGKLSYLNPRIANVALGPDGCDKCGRCPEPVASWPNSPVWKLPLLSPVPRFNPSVREAQRPWKLPEERASANDGHEGVAGDGSSNGRKDDDENDENDDNDDNDNGGGGVKLMVRCDRCLEGRYNKRTRIWECEYCWFGAAYCPKFDD